MPPEITRRSLLAFFGSAGVALAVAKTLPAPIREQVELALRDIEPPPGISYQWNLPEMITQASQWVKVPDERHGGSEIGGLILCERPLAITQASRQRDIDKARAQAAAMVDHVSGGIDNTGEIFMSIKLKAPQVVTDSGFEPWDGKLGRAADLDGSHSGDTPKFPKQA
jgi:hypothetical protein